MTIEEELDDMNKIFTFGTLEEDKVVDEPPVAEDPVNEDQEEEAVTEDKDGETSEDETTSDEPAAPEPSTDTTPSTEVSQRPAISLVDLEPDEVTAQDFLGDLDPDDLIRDPKDFNHFMNKIYQQAVKDSQKSLASKLNSMLPEMIRANVNAISAMQEASVKFYKDNADLEPFKKVVSVVFEELAASNPAKTYGELLKDVSTEARKRLDLHLKPVPKQPADERKPPKLPKKSGSVGRAADVPKSNPLLNEIEEMNKVLGGN